MADACFRRLALGDVLDQHDRAAVGHRLEGQVERAAFLGRDLERAGLAARQPCLEIHGQPLRFGAQDGARLDALVQQIACGEALAVNAAGNAENLDQPVVGDHQTTLGVEHAQAVRHVVERGVETAGEQRQVAIGDDRIKQCLAQPVGDEPQRHEERQQAQSEDRVVEAAGVEQRCAERDALADDLRRDQPVAGEVSTWRADHVGERHGETEQSAERIVGQVEGGEGPATEQDGIDGGTENVAMLPVTHRRNGVQLRARAPIGPHVDRPYAGHDDHRQREKQQGELADLPRGQRSSKRDRSRAQKKAPSVGIERVDQWYVDLSRKVRLLARWAMPMQGKHA